MKRSWDGFMYVPGDVVEMHQPTYVYYVGVTVNRNAQIIVTKDETLTILRCEMAGNGFKTVDLYHHRRRQFLWIPAARLNANVIIPSLNRLPS